METRPLVLIASGFIGDHLESIQNLNQYDQRVATRNLALTKVYHSQKHGKPYIQYIENI